ncbi:MAG TPA: GuaB3 family IMP dehydrogenase-related protein [Armatimonadota bacterium]|nr:GuaB3 family IMP dehydrogenase-related protein [Armatimonadota bacterium]
MEVIVGGRKKARQSYGFDEVAVVPAAVSIDVADVDTSWYLGDDCFRIPILASAMDGVTDPRLAIEMGKLGGLAVLNLEGVQTRYEDADAAIRQIIEPPADSVIPVIQKIYQEPIKPELIEYRIKAIKAGGQLAAVSAIPAVAKKYAEIIFNAGADIMVIQSTVTTAQFISSRGESVSIADFCKESPIPVIVGNSVTYEGAMSLMEAGADAVLVGVGPGAACTTRKVCGIGVPMITTTADSAAARDDFEARTGKYVPIISDGGMRTGGDIIKAFVAGADAVMIGSPIAAAAEAPGKGYHWGMATSHPGLPRGTRVQVGVKYSLNELLFGPANTDNGTMNLIGALKLAMSYCGARTIKELQEAEMIIAPSLPTEGKTAQRAQNVGQWR